MSPLLLQNIVKSTCFDSGHSFNRELRINELCNFVNLRSKVQYNDIQNISGRGKTKGLINRKYSSESIMEESRYQIIKITTSYYELLVAMIHNLSKRDYSEETQRELLGRFHHDIAEQETVHKCRNTIAIGDFNVNPFEIACISAGSMHAIPYREEASVRPERIVAGKSRLKFYNPTWKFFGNSTIPYTTYYKDKSGDAMNYYWNAFDQVMIRPELIEAFDESQLRIIGTTKNHVLLKNGKPYRTNYSDHLPLFCVLREELI